MGQGNVGEGGGVDFPECITDHMTRGRGLHPGGGVYIWEEGVCIQRGKGSASGEGVEVLHPGKRGSASSGVGQPAVRTRKADNTHPT